LSKIALPVSQQTLEKYVKAFGLPMVVPLAAVQPCSTLGNSAVGSDENVGSAVKMRIERYLCIVSMCVVVMRGCSQVRVGKVGVGEVEVGVGEVGVTKWVSVERVSVKWVAISEHSQVGGASACEQVHASEAGDQGGSFGV
jgi:hypothetical protein